MAENERQTDDLNKDEAQETSSAVVTPTSEDVADSATKIAETNTEIQQESDDDKEESVSKMASEAEPTVHDDFYDEFVAQTKHAQFVSDLQSSDTYWNNRTDEREKYEKEYGAEARAKFDEDYKKVEKAWRTGLEAKQAETAYNQHFEWLFGDGKDYDPKTVFTKIRAIDTGETILGDVMTEKQITDQAAALQSKSFMNDQGEIVKLDADEKWWKWGAGSGTEMDLDNPRYKSKDDRKIVAFEQVQFAPEYRGDRYLKAVYSGDRPTGQIVSVWDTTNSWLLNNDELHPSGFFKEIPKIGIRVVANTASSLLSSAFSLLSYPATWLDSDDDNSWTNWCNDEATIFKQTALSKNERDQRKTLTPTNAVEFVANVVAQLYVAKGMGELAMGTTKLVRAGNPLLVKAAAAQAAGKTKEAEQLVGMFEMTYGRAARNASTWGMALMQGNDIVTSARAAGFDEDSVGAIYLAFLGSMGAAARISTAFIDPWITGSVTKPFYKKLAQDLTPELKVAMDAVPSTAAKEKVMFKWARNYVNKLTDLAKVAGTTGGHTSNKIAAIALPSLTEAVEEETEWFMQEAVQTGATLISKYTSKDKDKYAKFQTIMDEGYLASQLPNIIMSGIGGAVGGGIAGFMPGFHHENETSFLVKGSNSEKMIKTAILGGEFETQFLDVLKKSYKSGALGPKELSVKLNPDTGEFYKMTDSQAKGSMNQADAAYNSITGQYAYYKSLYGNSGHSFDELMKLSPELKATITEARDNVLTTRLAKAHTEYRQLVETVMRDKTAAEALGSKKSAKEEKQTEAATKKADKVAAKDKTGRVTEEYDAEMETAEAKKAEETFSENVKKRAELYGTTNYTIVKSILEKEAEIDDLVTGRAAARLVIETAVKNGDSEFLKVFDPESAQDIFKSDTFKNFSGELLHSIFATDLDLANLHKARRADYVRDRDIIAEMVHGKLTPEILTHIASLAKNPIPLDPNSQEATDLYQKTYELVDKTISDKDFAAIVDEVRRAQGLGDRTTEDLMGELAELLHGRYETTEKISKDDAALDEYKQFLRENEDLVYDLGVSRYIDAKSSSKFGFLTAKIPTDKDLVMDTLLSNAVQLEDDYNESTSPIAEADALRKEYDRLSAVKGGTESEIIENEKALRALRIELNDAISRSIIQRDSRNNIVQGYEISYEEFVNNATSVFASSVASHANDTTATQLYVAPAGAPYKSIIDNYFTIMQNLSQEVPEIPINGAIDNLLNEIAIRNGSIVTTDNKIIDETDYITTEDDGRTETEATTPSGVKINLRTAQSVITDLNNSVLRKGTPFEEFRRLEDAKMAYDAVTIRIAQIEAVKQLAPILHTLQTYMDDFAVDKKKKYDVIPSFIARHIYDTQRFDELSQKKILTIEEQKDKDLINDRAATLFGSKGVIKQLSAARFLLENLITLGEDSLTANKRVLAYKEEAKAALNRMKPVFGKIYEIFEPANDEETSLKAAMLAFTGMTDLTKDDNLVKAHDMFVDIMSSLGKLPTAQAVNIAQNLKDTRDKELIIDALNPIRGKGNTTITSEEAFNENYNKVLSERKAAGEVRFPTIPQELMVKETFNFLVGDYRQSGQGPDTYQNMIFAGGAAGTGKTTMIGYAFAAAQRYAAEVNKGTSGAVNKVLPVSNYQESTINLRDRLIATGCDVYNGQANYVKRSLYSLLERVADDPASTDLDDISYIAYDEASMIQISQEPDVTTETQLISDLINKINGVRSSKGLMPLRMVYIGDQSQGTWNEGMPAINANEDVWLDWEHNKQDDVAAQRRLRFNYSTVMRVTSPLTYPFRTLCPKTTEFADDIKDRVDILTLLKSNKNSSIPKAAYSIIANDPIRQRLGGVKVTKLKTDLYEDEEVIDNIKKQIDADKEFSVIIVDNNKKSLAEFDKASMFGKLINDPKYSAHFRLYTTGSVQGMEADYVIADLSKKLVKFPPESSDTEQYDVAAMVVSRAKLFAKIAVAPTMRLESVEHAVVNMLEDAEAEALANEWNDFYLNKYRKILETAPTEESKEHPEESEEEPTKETQGPEEPVPGYPIPTTKTPVQETDDDDYNSTKLAQNTSVGDTFIRGTGVRRAKNLTSPPVFQYKPEPAAKTTLVLDPTSDEEKTSKTDEARALESLGFAFGYRQLYDGDINDCARKALMYSHDLFGGSAYKDSDPGIMEQRIAEYRDMIKDITKNPRKATYTLISYQNSPKISKDGDGEMKVDHAICVIYNNVPYFLYQLPTPPSEGASVKNAAWTELLSSRSKMVREASSELVDRAAMGDEFLPNEYFAGPKGYLNADKSFEFLKSRLTPEVLQNLPSMGNTRLFRSHVSGEREYAATKIPHTYAKSGLLIMETILSEDTAKALYSNGSTAGKLIKSRAKGAAEYSYNDTAVAALQSAIGTADVDDSILKRVVINGVSYPILTVTVGGDKSRTLTFVYKRSTKKTLTDSNGYIYAPSWRPLLDVKDGKLVIQPLDKRPDMEAQIMARTLDKQVIMRGGRGGSLATTTEEELHASLNKDNKPVSELLDIVDSMRTREQKDKTISLQELKQKTPWVKFSKPLIITSPALGNPALVGKSLVLYSTNPDVDLSTNDAIQTVLGKLRIMKATDYVGREDFNISDYARNGVGILMLDSPTFSLNTIVSKITGKNKMNISYPANSAVSQNMFKAVASIAKMLISGEDTTKISISDFNKVLNRISSKNISSKDVKELVARAKKLSPEAYEALRSVFYHSTIDANLGSHVLYEGGGLSNIAFLLEQNRTEEAQSAFDAAKKDVTLAKRLDGTNTLEEFKLKYATPESIGYKTIGTALSEDGTLIVKNGMPVVANTYEAPMTFMEYNESKVAAFNMTNFAKLIKSYGKTASVIKEMSDWIDSVLYEQFDEFKNGIQWSGNITKDFPRKLGVAVLDEDSMLSNEDGSGLTTSVKFIAQPSALIDINKLAKDVYKTTVAPKTKASAAVLQGEKSPADRQKAAGKEAIATATQIRDTALQVNTSAELNLAINKLDALRKRQDLDTKVKKNLTTIYKEVKSAYDAVMVSDTNFNRKRHKAKLEDDGSVSIGYDFTDQSTLTTQVTEDIAIGLEAEGTIPGSYIKFANAILNTLESNADKISNIDELRTLIKRNMAEKTAADELNELATSKGIVPKLSRSMLDKINKACETDATTNERLHYLMAHGMSTTPEDRNKDQEMLKAFNLDKKDKVGTIADVKEFWRILGTKKNCI